MGKSKSIYDSEFKESGCKKKVILRNEEMNMLRLAQVKLHRILWYLRSLTNLII